MSSTRSHDAPAGTLFDPAAGGWAPLGGLGVLRARGADAARFLQGQLTQEVLKLPPDRAALAGYCSAKGRLLASFVLLKDADDDISLLVSADLAATVAKRLSMFVLRAQCKLSDVGSERPAFAFFGARAFQSLDAVAAAGDWGRGAKDGVLVLRLPNVASMAAFAVLGQPELVSATFPDLGLWMNAEPALGFDAWSGWLVGAGVPWVVAATQEQFVPQMVNLELLQGVSFQKGCYPGQEVVARSQYRGTNKRRMLRFISSAPAKVGDELFHSADPSQPAGLVAVAAQGAAHAWLLAEVKLAALTEGELHLRTPQGPDLQLDPLPYAVPELETAAGSVASD